MTLEAVYALLTIDFGLQLLASAFTIVSSWAYGNKSLRGPAIGLAAQVPWWIMMVHGGLWGLLPVNILMTVMHVRNFWKWMK